MVDVGKSVEEKGWTVPGSYPAELESELSFKKLPIVDESINIVLVRPRPGLYVPVCNKWLCPSTRPQFEEAHISLGFR